MAEKNGLRHKKKKRVNQDTTVRAVAADPRAIMAALLRTPPPPAGHEATRKALPKKRVTRGPRITKNWTVALMCPKCGYQWKTVIARVGKPKTIVDDCYRCAEEGEKRVISATVR